MFTIYKMKAIIMHKLIFKTFLFFFAMSLCEQSLFATEPDTSSHELLPLKREHVISPFLPITMVKENTPIPFNVPSKSIQLEMDENQNPLLNCMDGSPRIPLDSEGKFVISTLAGDYHILYKKYGNQHYFRSGTSLVANYKDFKLILGDYPLDGVFDTDEHICATSTPNLYFPIDATTALSIQDESTYFSIDSVQQALIKKPYLLPRHKISFKYTEKNDWIPEVTFYPNRMNHEKENHKLAAFLSPNAPYTYISSEETYFVPVSLRHKSNPTKILQSHAREPRAYTNDTVFFVDNRIEFFVDFTYTKGVKETTFMLKEVGFKSKDNRKYTTRDLPIIIHKRPDGVENIIGRPKYG